MRILFVGGKADGQRIDVEVPLASMRNLEERYTLRELAGVQVYAVEGMADFKVLEYLVKGYVRFIGIGA